MFDDIQWGEETFLDLVEHVALLSTGAPILLLCLARRELAERRREWPVALRLEPLPEAEVDRADPGEARRRPAQEDHPRLGREPAVRHRDGGDGCGEPRARSLSRRPCEALLAARLDQLEGGERSVLERGAVEGEIFHRGAVQALSEGGHVTPRLASLVRKGLIRPDEGADSGGGRVPLPPPADPGHRLRRAAQGDASRPARALRRPGSNRRGEDLVELDEILGYHLEQAARYKAELGQPDPALAERAGEHLAAAGRRALLAWRRSSGRRRCSSGRSS